MQKGWYIPTRTGSRFSSGWGSRSRDGVAGAGVILKLHVKALSGILAFPVPSLLEGPVKGYCPGSIAFIHTAAAVPAFIGMQDNGRLALLRIRDIHVYQTHLHALVAAIAYFFIENHRLIGSGYIRNSVNFLISHLYKISYPR